MKTRQVTLIGTVLALSALSLPFIISETSPKSEIQKIPNLELIDELVDLGCTESAINHVFRYSNLLDDSFDGSYFIEWIRLPDDLPQVKFDKCVKIILEKRIPELYKYTPEVVAFYTEYEDAQVSLRDDHISYVSGGDDGLKIRMKLFFDENYALVDKSLTCYYKKAFQFESSPEDVLYRLQNNECKQPTVNFDLSKIDDNMVNTF